MSLALALALVAESLALALALDLQSLITRLLLPTVLYPANIWAHMQNGRGQSELEPVIGSTVLVGSGQIAGPCVKPVKYDPVFEF